MRFLVLLIFTWLQPLIGGQESCFIMREKGKNNGLTHCWLSSSLKISPQEQIELVEKLLSGKMPLAITPKR
jgi:hypothetical protein